MVKFLKNLTKFMKHCKIKSIFPIIYLSWPIQNNGPGQDLQNLSWPIDQKIWPKLLIAVSWKWQNFLKTHENLWKLTKTFENHGKSIKQLPYRYQIQGFWIIHVTFPTGSGIIRMKQKWKGWEIRHRASARRAWLMPL